MNRFVSSPTRRRIILSVAAALVAVLSLTAAMEELLRRTPLSELDAGASAYYDGAVKKALTTYAVARMLNAAISAVQGTEVAVSPAGMGVRLSVGEVLDPVNDLIERFSWILLLSTVSLGVQSVLMEVGSWFGLRVLLSVSMILLLAGLWLPLRSRTRIWSLGMRLLVAAVVVRLCIPIIGVTNRALDEAFLAERYDRSTQSLEAIRGKIRMPIVPPEAEEQPGDGLLGRLKKRYEDTREALAVQRRLEALKDTVEGGIEHITSLMVVFLLQTVVAPLLVLWGLIKLAGGLVRTPGRSGGSGFLLPEPGKAPNSSNPTVAGS